MTDESQLRQYRDLDELENLWKKAYYQDNNIQEAKRLTLEIEDLKENFKPET